MSVVIDADRVNYFRDMIDAICVSTGVELTTAQSWDFAREYARLEAEANGTSKAEAHEGETE